MNTTLRSLTTTLAFATITTACATTPLDVPAFPPGEPEYTLVWVGRGEAERLVDGAWRRAPEFDYDFSVQQVRYGDRWSSVKSMRRRHPDYDGSAGPRAQTYFFQIGYQPAGADGQVKASIVSTLGQGQGHADAEFRESVLEIEADISAIAPFDTYRITQWYGYEAGELRETVELLDHDGEREVPWVRNNEVARLFAPQQLPGAPTRAPASR
jgi:hypothetical protein